METINFLQTSNFYRGRDEETRGNGRSRRKKLSYFQGSIGRTKKKKKREKEKVEDRKEGRKRGGRTKKI